MRRRNSIVVWAALLYCAGQLNATTLVVFNANDSLAGSLRQAILNSAAGDTIVFHIPTSDPGYDPATGVFTISLSSAELAINHNLVIDGGTNKITVPAQCCRRNAAAADLPCHCRDRDHH